MNNQLKLLLYILFVVVIFFVVQNKFNLFDITFLDGVKGVIELKKDEGSKTEDKPIQKDCYIELVREGEAVKVFVEVANDDPERKLGLSFRKYLGDYNGMFFMYDSNTLSPFWMKDMLIPLDIIFIDEKGFIVDIKADQQPCSAIYCPYIYPKAQYRYVLETNTGFAKNNGIKEGQSIVKYLDCSN